MVVSGASRESNPSTAGTVSRAFLIPTATGAWYAVSVGNDETRREVLLALLRGASCFPVSLAWFTEWTQLRERRAIASMLFSLQREELLSGDATPMQTPHGPGSVLLPQLLARAMRGGEAVLADPAGLCVAFANMEQEAAETRAARVAALDPRLRRIASDSEGWSLGGGESDPRLTVRPLHLGPYRFLLAFRQSATIAGDGFVQFVSVLARHCLGDVAAPAAGDAPA